MVTDRNRAFKDEVGNRYGYVEVLEYCRAGGRGAMWVCRCDCGEVFEERGTQLRRGKVTSCGKCEYTPRHQLAMAIASIGTPPCELDSICPMWKRCADEQLSCTPFNTWARSGGRIVRNLEIHMPSEKLFRELYH